MEEVHEIFSFFFFFLSVPILASGIWLHSRFPANYAGFLHVVFISIGALLLLHSLLGYWAAFKRARRWLLRANVVSLFFLIVLAFGFTVFAFRASYRKTVHVASGLGYEDFHLLDGDAWLQKWVNNDANWKKTRRRLVDLNPCEYLFQSHQTFQQFVHNDIGPIQSGCCKPPYECGYLYRNPTVWERPPTGPLTNNTDCERWSNRESSLCYDCGSCKASVITKVKKDWKRAAIINIVFLSFLFLAYPFGCYIPRSGRVRSIV